jgi:hypothetical protein
MLMKLTIAFEKQERKDIIEAFQPIHLLNLSPEHLEEANKKVIRVSEGNQVSLEMMQDALSLTKHLEYRIKQESTKEATRKFLGSPEPNKPLPEKSIPLATNAEMVVQTIVEARQLQLERLCGARKHMERGIAALTAINALQSNAVLLNKALGIREAEEDEEIDEEDSE